jgi:hypothetical protein
LLTRRVLQSDADAKAKKTSAIATLAISNSCTELNRGLDI